MANLMVTGGAGFIGANFVHHWRRVAPSDTIVVLDALTYAGNQANLDGLDGVEFVHGNICDTALVYKIMTDHVIDTIVHFAAESHVDRSIVGPDAFVTTNVFGTLSLLNAAKSSWLDKGSGTPHRFHHVSTDEVYGSLGADDKAFNESTAYAPNSPYSASKAGSDHLVRAYHHTYGLETTTSNCSNNYGPFQFPEKLIPLIILNALAGQKLPIYGDGMNVRDWLHVEDHCKAIELIIRAGLPGEVYNVGGGHELTNIEVVNFICNLIDLAFSNTPELAEQYPHSPAAKGVSVSTLKVHVEDRKGHDRRYAIDETKIREQLGYSPTYDVVNGFERTLNWYLDNSCWWKTLSTRAA